MKYAARWIKIAAAVFCLVLGSNSLAHAADLPLAAASPLSGVAFDDRPLLLPVQRNFQMAMLTAGSELGRSCGKMEAYGWRMSQTEQARVNQIFNNTVDRMRMMGYTIAPQTLSSVSNDITLFTADRADKHFIFLWSAGELGLVMTLCETTAPLSPTYKASPLVPSVQVFPVPMSDVVSTQLAAPGKNAKAESDAFTPLGHWTGTYTCAQGLTGGTLDINHLRGQNFDGVFRFYPTPKNRTVPDGSYAIYGQYDKESKRILINPGSWIHHPAHFYNTVMVGSFDPIRENFSAYFQGITGCTSFEAHRIGEEPQLAAAHKKASHHVRAKKPVKKAHVVKKKKAAAAPARAAVQEAAPASIPATTPDKPADSGVPVPSNVPVTPSAADTPVPATSAVPVAPASVPVAAPAASDAHAATKATPVGTPAPDAGIMLPGTK